MQTSCYRTDGRGTALYGKGTFAFLCAAALIGVLLGTLCFCMGAGQADRLIFFGDNGLKVRAGMDHGRIMAGSLLGSTVFLLGLAAAGLCAVGQPFELALLVLRCMGLGYTMAEIYSSVDRSDVIYAAGLLLPGAVISTLGLIAAAREAVCLSNIYLRLTLSDRQEQGLAEAAKLYFTKLLVIEALLALAAGADTVCNYLFIGRLT